MAECGGTDKGSAMMEQPKIPHITPSPRDANHLAAFGGTKSGHANSEVEKREDVMNKLLDLDFLQDQLRQSQAAASAAIHPDVKAAYQSYVTHYQTLLEALRARGRVASPINV